MSILISRHFAARAAWLLCVPVIAGRLAAQVPAIRAGQEDEAAREAWFWMQRSYPGTERPYAAMRQARAAAMQRFAHTASTSAAGAFGGGWRSLGPFGLFNAETGYFDSSPQLDAGRVPAVAPNPVAGGPLFIGTATGGVWRADALGIGWAPLTDDQCALSTGALAIDPVNPSIVYAGTGELNAPAGAACGVLRSTDGGTSWASVGRNSLGGTVSGAADFGQIVVDRASAGSTANTLLIAATSAGVYRSNNSGNSWQLTLTGRTASVVEDAAAQGVYFAGVTTSAASTRGVYRSTDNGVTWSPLPPLVQTTPDSISRIELAVSAAAPHRLYVLAGAQTSRMLGLWIWDDSTGQWQRLPAKGVYTGDPRGDFGGQSSYDLTIAVDPRDANRIYIAGVRAFVSTDGGQTFTPMGMEIHCDWHRIVIDPNNPDILYAGTDGGIFISTDAGESWTSRNAGLAIAQFYPGISVAPQGTLVLGGTQDNSTSLYSGALTWTGAFATGDGGYTAINYSDPTILWASGYWGGGPNILRHSATGTTARNNGIATTDRGQFMPPLVMDPVTPTKLYFGTQRLYRTTNDGASWTAVTSDLTSGSGSLSTIAVAPSDTLTIYVGANDGTVQVSRDGGTTFTRSTGLPGRYITRIAVDPDTATHAVLTVSGFGSGHVFETRDGGVSWTNISGNLVDAPASAAVLVPGTGVIVVGTDVGVFQTANDGATWQPGPTGMPNAIVLDLVYSRTSHLLVAGTYGRGIFAYTVGTQGAVLRGDVNGDGKVDAFDALLLQQSLVSSLPASTVVYPAGDANCNGGIESADVELVLRNAVGLPTGTACVGTVR